MLRLYGTKTSRALRVIWALEEMGLDYDLDQAKPRSEKILALNPLGQVPVLTDGDAVLTDSLAILHYLADGNAALTYPPGTPERAKMDARINFVLTEMEAPIWLMARHGFVLPEEKRVPGMRLVAEPDFAIGAARFEKLLDDEPFFGGDIFTIADIVAAQTIGWAKLAKLPVEGAASAYLERMTSRKAFARAMTRE